jgi:hypothetical protein
MLKTGLWSFLAVSVTVFGAENYAQWKYARDITVNTTDSGAGVGVTQYRFPLLVRLNSGNFDFTKALSNASDIRFTKANGTTRLPHQVERWDSAGQAAEVWVLADTVFGHSSTTVKMYFGKTGVADSSSATAVFMTADVANGGNNFQAVFHLNEAANDTIRDVTANGFKGIPKNRGGVNPADVTGVIGKAKNFLGSNSNNNGGSYRIVTSTGGNTYTNNPLNFQNDSSTVGGLPRYTISAWIKTSSFPDSIVHRKAIIAKSIGQNVSGGSGGRQYHMRLMEPTQTNPVLDTNRVEFSDGVAAIGREGSDKFDTTTWVHIAAVRNFVRGVSGSSMVFVNGRAAISGNSVASTERSDYDVYIGSFSNDSGYFTGKIDEVEFSNRDRDSDWVRLSYHTQKPGVNALGVGVQQQLFPSNLAYPANPAIYAVGIPISPNVRTQLGLATHYSISPALPAGLTLDSVTGIIFGTPLVISSPTNYTVTATSQAGSATAIVNIRVLTPPSNLSYTKLTPVYGVNVAITSNIPTVSGDVTSYSVTPALPTGLSLDTLTGVIAGTPTVVIPSANYIVTASNPAASTTKTINITVLAPPSSLSYAPGSGIYGVGLTLTETPTVTGTVQHYSVSPALPTGLSLDTLTGLISGAPTTVSTATNYTVTASNVAGSTNAILNLTTMLVPSNLAYRRDTVEFAATVAITPDSPFVTGAISHYSLSATLPPGLTMDTLTGILSGTPTSEAPTTSFVVTATNPVGSTMDTLWITVTIAPPSNLHYTLNNAVYGTGVTINSNEPTVTGTATHYSVSPALPAGLSMDAFTGIITGTPSAAIPTTNFVVTASNFVGSTQDTLVLTVLAAPTGFSYPANPAVFGVNVTIPNDSPSVTGTVTGYSVSPALPAGLSINSFTGVISGTTTVVQAAANYTIKAFNGPAFATTVLSITVLAPPSGLSYSKNPATYGTNVAITANTPSVIGTVTHYSVIPALPSGLLIDSITGVISGSPNAAQAAASYQVKTENVAGFDTETIVITVLNAPSGLSYPSVKHWRGVASSPASPTVTGVVSRYSISPALPTGLTLDTITGVISGTPSVASPATNYTVTASNVGGSATATVNIRVYPPPSALSYSASPATYGVNVVITPNTPNVTDTVTRYSVTLLPAGLTLDTITGVISGTPTVVSGFAVYTVTASNPAGSTNSGVSIRVLAAPSSLSYATSTATYGVNVTIPNDSSTVTGVVTRYSVAPALPSGLLLDSVTGVISGAATASSAAANYTITASNIAGSTTTIVNIRVLAPPSSLSYSQNPATYGVNVSITDNVAAVTGVVARYSVSPALPTGLVLDTVTGKISGTPTVSAAAANYTVTASNVGGFTTTTLNLRVLAAPSALSYSQNPAVYGVNVAITNNVPTLTGVATHYSVSPALPTGLILDTNTGILSGTSTVVRSGTNYTVTASNLAGSTTATLNIRVLAPPTNFSYADDPVVYVLGVAINPPDIPTVTGFVSRYTASPALPPGVILDSVTGYIAGTPTTRQSFATTYTITAANVAGSTQTTVNITIVGPPSNLSYADDVPTYARNQVITPPNTPTIQGIVTQYTVTPTLPTGIVLDATTGYILGTPTVVSASRSYTITGSNPGGSSTTIINLGVAGP